MSIDWAKLVLGPNLQIFGEDPEREGAVLWRSATTGLYQQVPAIFDEGYKPLATLGYPDGLMPANITTGTPHLGVSLSDFPQDPQQGDIMQVRGKTYTIREVQKDSHGGADIYLNVTGMSE